MSNVKNNQIIAAEIAAKTIQVTAATELLDAGDTVPFIARYRKEVTGGLDDGQLRHIAERLQYLRELDDRKQTILTAIDEQDKLSPLLKQQIIAADSKTRLEDLYLPYKKKRRTKAQLARLAGLEPLLEQLIAQPQQAPETLAKPFINREQQVEDAATALQGARYIALENFSEDADLLQNLRHQLWEEGVIIAKKCSVEKSPQEQQKADRFKDYFDFSEAVKSIPSHRILALLRGRNEGFLQLQIDHSDTLRENLKEHPAIAILTRHCGWNTAQSEWLKRTIELAWKSKLSLKLNLQLTTALREQADEAAIQIFADNLKNLLLTAPAGGYPTLGLDPGYRTGVKVVAIDGNGKLLETAVIYPHAPQKQWEKSKQIINKLCQRHQIKLIAIGNGTASRETDQMTAEILRQNPDLKTQKIMISEAGASVYSASEQAAKEFPQLDVSYRGAVSIARRLQDPLAELVKIEPKAIGVGQYQHDVNQMQLNRALNDTVEDCVNAVGVDVNTASSALLKHVAGITDKVAHEIVEFRDSNGSFNNRKQLLEVKFLGDKMFKQCAGFLRINDGEQPLDQSAVHPEAYPLVEQILDQYKLPINQVIGKSELLDQLQVEQFTTEQFGKETVKDLIEELKKPGRDPRGEFKTAKFNDQVQTIADLVEGMELEGTVTNVTAFGAFVDVGVHQDGLVHISQLSNRFIKDPAEVVKAGQLIKVRVLEVDEMRKRISLTAKTTAKSAAAKPNKKAPSKIGNKHNRQGNKKAGSPKNRQNFNTSLSDAFLNAKKITS